MRHDRQCFELVIGSSRLLLDYSCGTFSLFLRYLPMGGEDQSTVAALGCCVHCNGEWLLDGSVQVEVPPQSIDLAGVTAVLVSGADAMLTLPFLTEYMGFTGLVLATNAAKHFGHLAMLELAQLCKSPCGGPTNRGWHQPPIAGSLGINASVHNLPTRLPMKIWDLMTKSRLPYGLEDVERCMTRIVGINFGESVEIGDGLHVLPQPSGAGLGATNWWIQCGRSERIIYIATSMMASVHPVPASAATSGAGAGVSTANGTECASSATLASVPSAYIC